MKQTRAGHVAQYVYRLLVSRDPDISETYVDLVAPRYPHHVFLTGVVVVLRFVYWVLLCSE